MENYIKKIVKDNFELFNNCEINKINIGFTNSIYSAGDKYIIKICSNKENEKRFKNEIDFYLNNKNNKYIPKLYKYYLSTSEKDYSYEIIEKINGKSLYFLWHTFNEVERKDIVEDICKMMKSFHNIKGETYDWAQFIKNKLVNDFDKCNNNDLFNSEEKEKIEFVISNIASYLKDNEFSLVHSDIHFDNILLDNEGNIKLIDFETAIYAPIDYELDIFLRMCNNPLKYSSEETEEYVKMEDYINISKYLKQFYPEIFEIHDFKIRHSIYDLEANFRLLARFPNNKELQEIVINIINELILLINKIK